MQGGDVVPDGGSVVSYFHYPFLKHQPGFPLNLSPTFVIREFVGMTEGGGKDGEWAGRPGGG